jgi:hypothetical protein
MNSFPKVLLFVVTLFAGLFVTGCPEHRSIAEIEANPGRYQNKEVVIVGVVKDSYGLSIPGTRYGGGAYKIDDGTGSIWIVTDDAVPNKGAEVGVRGTVGSGINWKGKTYGLGMYEKERKYKKR